MTDTYSDTNNLGTIFGTLEGAQLYLQQVVKDRISLQTAEALNDLPKVVEVTKKIGKHTYTFYLVAFV